MCTPETRHVCGEMFGLAQNWRIMVVRLLDGEKASIVSPVGRGGGVKNCFVIFSKNLTILPPVFLQFSPRKIVTPSAEWEALRVIRGWSLSLSAVLACLSCFALSNNPYRLPRCP